MKMGVLQLLLWAWVCAQHNSVMLIMLPSSSKGAAAKMDAAAGPQVADTPCIAAV
jgi:hypothetical protein